MFMSVLLMVDDARGVVFVRRRSPFSIKMIIQWNGR
jgi:hypothetical protein